MAKTLSNSIYEHFFRVPIGHLSSVKIEDGQIKESHMWGVPSLYSCQQRTVTSQCYTTLRPQLFPFLNAENKARLIHHFKLSDESDPEDKLEEILQNRFAASVERVTDSYSERTEHLYNPTFRRIVSMFTFKYNPFQFDWRSHIGFSSRDRVICSEFVLKIDLNALVALEKQLSEELGSDPIKFNIPIDESRRLGRVTPDRVILAGLVNEGYKIVKPPAVLGQIVDYIPYRPQLKGVASLKLGEAL